MAKPPAKPARTAAPREDSEAGRSLTFEEEIDRQIGDLIPQNARTQVVSRITSLMVSEHFSGPIAHPRHLREYEEIAPGSANRIITMAEDRNRHIMNMERTSLLENVADQKRGMNYGASLFALLVLAALVSAIVGLGPVIVGIFMSAAAIGGITIFIKGRNGS